MYINILTVINHSVMITANIKTVIKFLKNFKQQKERFQKQSVLKDLSFLQPETEAFF